MDEQVFIRDDGDTKAKRRKKNVLVYNPDHKDTVTIDVSTNITIRQSGIEVNGCKASSSAKLVRVEVKAEGCTFAQVKITDSNNNITYVIKSVLLMCFRNILKVFRRHTCLMFPRI